MARINPLLELISNIISCYKCGHDYCTAHLKKCPYCERPVNERIGCKRIQLLNNKLPERCINCSHTKICSKCKRQGCYKCHFDNCCVICIVPGDPDKICSICLKHMVCSRVHTNILRQDLYKFSNRALFEALIKGKLIVGRPDLIYDNKISINISTSVCSAPKCKQKICQNHSRICQLCYRVFCVNNCFSIDHFVQETSICHDCYRAKVKGKICSVCSSTVKKRNPNFFCKICSAYACEECHQYCRSCNRFICGKCNIESDLCLICYITVNLYKLMPIELCMIIGEYIETGGNPHAKKLT